MPTEADNNTDDLRTMLRSETDFGVLRMMGESDPAWTKAAFEEFYDRHKGYLWARCSEVCANLGCNGWVEDLFSETFDRAYRSAAKFKFPPCPTKEEDYVINAWLGTIAQNRLCDRWRATRLERTKTEEQWSDFAETAFAPAPADTEKTEAPSSVQMEEMRLVDEAMNALTEREAHVLRITAQYHRIGRKSQRLPNDVTDDLAEALNTTPENLRKIRERAKKKVRQYVDERRGKIST